MRKLLGFFLILLCIAALVGTYFLYSNYDRQPPAIVVMKEDGSYHEGITQKELLEGVTAIDSKDGDVSSTLTVENVYPNGEDRTVSVIYAAKDKSNNVCKYTHVMPVEGEMPLLPVQPTVTVIGEQAEEGSGDGQGAPDNSPEAVAARERVAKAAEEARHEEEVKIAGLRPEAPIVRLKEYYIEVQHGAQLDQLSYVDSIEDDVDDITVLFTRIQVYSNVDTAVPGSYEMTYYVLDSNGNQSNMATLRVRVL